jgi:hypothetical protein
MPNVNDNSVDEVNGGKGGVSSDADEIEMTIDVKRRETDDDRPM